MSGRWFTMKMLTTQIGGLMQRLTSQNEESIEETARLLAQATIGQGQVFIAGFGELEAVCLTALDGVEPFTGAARYAENIELGTQDRMWIFSRYANDGRALEVARHLASRFIPFAAVATEKPGDSNELAALATTYIEIGLTRGLLPGDDGERIVQPHALAALFVYEAVKIAYDEMFTFN